MNKIQLLLLDEDPVYANHLMAFVRASDYADKLNVKLFTKLEYVERQLEDGQGFDILLISETFVPFLSQTSPSTLVLHLSHTLSGNVEMQEGMPSFYRFQPLHQLLTRVLAYYAERNQVGVAASKKSTQVISFFSSVGNSGKTSAAIHLAKQLSFRGKRVFYLNLESLSSISLLLPSGEQQHFSQILYYLRTTPTLLGAKLELLKRYDPRSGIDFLTPCHHIREAQEMSGDDIQLLVEALIKLNSYDFILLDLEASLHVRIIKALEISDQVLWMVMDDLNCLHKTIALKKAINSLSSIHFILNKFTGSLYNDYNSVGIPIKGYLPYIPEWKTVHAPEQIWSASTFSEQIYTLYCSLADSRHGVSA
ncbi:CobQ/CobB/MinD/ParA nucleotide binding domain protein [compost metagenome]